MGNLADTRRGQVIDWLGQAELPKKPEPGFRREHSDRDWFSDFADEPESNKLSPPATQTVTKGLITSAAQTMAPAESAGLRFRTLPRPRHVAVVLPVVLALALVVGIIAKSASSRPAEVSGTTAPAALAPETQPPATAPSSQPIAQFEASPQATPPPPAPQRRSPSPEDAPTAAPVAPDKKRSAAEEPPAPSLKEPPVRQVLPVENVATIPASAIELPVRPAALVVTPPPDRRPEPPAPPAAPAPSATPAASAREIETAAVQSVLARYRAAYGSLSVSSVQSVWPDANARTLSRAFEQLQSQQLDFESCGVEVYLLTGNASASCRGSATFVPKVGGRSERTEQRAWSFKLSRIEGRWVIVSVESR